MGARRLQHWDAQSVRVGDEEVPLERKVVGALSLPSGRLVVCDVLSGDLPPFRRTVPKGRFPVELTLAHFSEKEVRVAYSTIRFTAAKPFRWILARRPSGDWFWKFWKRASGVPVDSWHIGFMDNATCEIAYDDFTRYFGSDPLLMEHQANGGVWNERKVSDNANIISFFSGMGSGVYDCYFGVLRSGKLCCLACDLAIWERESHR